MKKLFVILVIFQITNLGYGQEIFISKDTLFERQSYDWVFTDVIYVDSTVNKDELFQQVRQWFSYSFVSAKNVIDNADKDAGIIYGRGIYDLNAADDGYVEFNIEVRVRDGRIKYTVNNFFHKGAYRKTIFGNRATNPIMIDDGGVLNQNGTPQSLKWIGRAEERWSEIRWESKKRTYNLVQSLRNNMNSENLKKTDDW